MAEVTVSSGAKVVVNIADFDDAMTLKNAIASELAKGKLQLEGLTQGDLDIQNMMSLDMKVIEPLLQVALTIDSAPEVNKAIFVCLEKCLYNGEKITKQTFNPEEARADYYEIVIACLKVNLTPFFKGLLSKFLAPETNQA